MRFSYFSKVSAKAEPCTYEKFLEVTETKELARQCNYIASAETDEKRAELKRRLPLITWQASFKERRKNNEAEPSGLYMLDIDHVENPGLLYAERIAGHLKEWDILFVAKTASLHGLRIVAECRPEFETLEQCQRWLAEQIGTEYDSVCKDWARASFVTHSSYTLFMNADRLFHGEPKVVYDIKGAEQPQAAMPLEGEEEEEEAEDATIIKEYNGVDLKAIAHEWLINNGGEPKPGERNAKLYKLALRMRYICDFKAATLLYALPDCGLPADEMRQIVRSALSTTRGAEMPQDLMKTVRRLEKQKALGDDDLNKEIELEPMKMPSLPPVIRDFCNVAPADFKVPTALIQLPILGALGSRLRARYLDGTMHSPSFMVSLEAPQASGKSFARKLVNYELAMMKEHDEAERQREREYNEKLREIKLTSTKLTKKDKDEIMGEKPKTIIRYVPPTMSITMLLQRMNNAKGCHLFALAEEIDTVYKAFKRGFSSFSDALRCSFDNAEYGQDYASENSFSGVVQLYYNCLFCGTPKAMRRFYPDVEDGLVSRVLFVTLPDQFGKPMPVWSELAPKVKRVVDMNLVRLNEITLQGDAVQPEHEVPLGWLLPDIKEWIARQQQMAVQMDDRARDIFCRRSAVVGFRAAMLAYFLWEERNSPQIHRMVKNFALWVAEQMLNQQILRFNMGDGVTNDIPFRKAYELLPLEPFNYERLRTALSEAGCETQARHVIYKWKLAGMVEVIGKRPHLTFKKTRE